MEEINLEKFVSTPQELISQFQVIRAHDRMVFEIYPPSFRNLSLLLESIRDFLIQNSESYLWNYEVWNLSISDNNCIQGMMEFNDNLEDEWFLVYLLVKSSIIFPDLCFSIRDNDGEFLLAEAADVLPNWISPENSENRVWVKEGKLLILSDPLDVVNPEESSANGNRGPFQLSDALSVLRSVEEERLRSENARPLLDSLFSSRIQSAIEARISLYPTRISALHHSSLMVLPQPLSQLLDRHPSLLPLLVRSFLDPQSLLPPQSPPLSINFSSLYHSLPYFSSCLSLPLLVPTVVRFSKSLFARLSFKTSFHPPKRFRPLLEGILALPLQSKSPLITGSLLRGEDQSQSLPPSSKASLQRCLDLTSRLVCGAEVALSIARHLFPVPPEPTPCPSSTAGQLWTLLNELQSPSSSIESHSCNNFDPFLVSLLHLSPTDPIPHDSEHWLCLSPDELEEEMRSRTTHSSPNSKADPYSLPSQSQTLRESFLSFQSFLSASSGPEGVEISNPSVKVEMAESVQGGKEHQQLVIDLEIVFRILEDFENGSKGDEEQRETGGGKGDGYFSEEDFEEEEEDQSDEEEEGWVGKGLFFLPSLSRPRLASDSSEFDSDDEEEEKKEGQEPLDWSMNDIMAAMDSELSAPSSSLPLSFQGGPRDAMSETDNLEANEPDPSPSPQYGSFDPELNFLASLLQAQEAQISGGVGRASAHDILLAQLKTSLPAPPPLNDRRKGV